MSQRRAERLQQTRLRIVHCVRAPIGGIFRNVLDLAQAQARSGHAVGIVLDSLTGGEFEASKIADAAPFLELGVTRLPMPRSVNPTDLVTAGKVFGTVRRLRPDILHGHGAKGGAFARVAGTLISLREPAVARFYSLHGGTLHYSRTSLAGRLFFAFERWLERMCDGLIHVSRFEARSYVEKVGTPRCRASVVLNGLRKEEFEAIEADADAADFVYMGMMRDLKGGDVLIRALAQLRDRTGYTPTLNMFGEGDDRASYQELARDLGLGEAVRFHHPVPTRDGMRRGRIMVVPSRAESMPYIVLETVAAGMPIVATRVGGIPEILDETGANRLVEPGDVEALADALDTALANPGTLRDAAHTARIRLRQRFTVDHMSDTVEALYRQALRRRRVEAPRSGVNFQTVD